MRTTILENITPRYIVNEEGKKTEVILNIKTYEQLLEELEDFYLGKAAEAVLKTDKKRYSLASVKREILSKKTKGK